MAFNRSIILPNMTLNTCQVLLIEKNSDQNQIDLIEKLLSDQEPTPLGLNKFSLTHVNDLADGLDDLQIETFDVVLLDLTLAKNQDLETLATLINCFPQVPVVVLIENDDPTLVVKAFQLGAHGFLPKNSIDRNLLIYALRLAIERQVQIIRLETIQKQQSEQELQSLERFVNSAITSVTGRLYGSERLHESAPHIIQEFIREYGHLLDLALEQQAYRVEHNISDKLRPLAEKLGLLKAGPRDVVEIHTQALREKTQNVNLTKAQAYAVEGRLMILELMGYLTSFYRKYYIGLSNINISQGFHKAKQQ